MDKQKEILQLYQQSVRNFRTALSEAGMTESLILYNTINFPDLTRLLPEDVIKLYAELKIMIIFYFDNLGFSSREIARRLGGHGDVSVRNILNEYKKKITSSTEANATNTSTNPTEGAA